MHNHNMPRVSATNVPVIGHIIPPRDYGFSDGAFPECYQGNELNLARDRGNNFTLADPSVVMFHDADYV